MESVDEYIASGSADVRPILEEAHSPALIRATGPVVVLSANRFTQAWNCSASASPTPSIREITSNGICTA